MSSGKTCHCHGISGSCTLEICHSELPSFDELAKKIKQAYMNSCLVSANGHSRNGWESKCGRAITEDSLIHTAEDTWCQDKPEFGSVGVTGRECNPLHGAHGSCDTICTHCNVGSQESQVVIEKQCECKFKFCCEIDCEVCEEKKTFYSCS